MDALSSVACHSTISSDVLPDKCEVSHEPSGVGTADAERTVYPWRGAKKVAVMLSFCGKSYYGMQRNYNLPTIEEELLKSFREAKAIDPDWYDNPSKAFFQRASRTDKGVSAAQMIISLKLVCEDELTTICRINSFLPDDIHVHAIKRVTKNFNPKIACDARTYLYMLPTFAFCPIDEVVSSKFRMSEDLRQYVNTTLGKMIGVHYFHNYTSGKLPLEPSSQRFITSFECGEPFEREDMQFCVISITGQSFMLHQIRKMVGMVIGVVRGMCNEDVIEQSWKMERIDIPKAPGLGLLLQEIHFNTYNRRFGSDGMHHPLSWEKQKVDVDRFKEEFIFKHIEETELLETSMLNWMENLLLHNFQRLHFENTSKGGDHEATID